MKSTLRHILTGIVLATVGTNAFHTEAQIVIEPLFEYVMAPDSLTSLTDRSNYIVEHFWERMDFKNKKTVDQNALNDAFSVYATPMQWADLDVISRSTDRLLKQIKGNQALALQFTKAAEVAFYSPTAPFWSDNTYLKFVDALLADKKVSADRKARFKRHSAILHNTLVGQKPPKFEYTTAEGKTALYHPNGVITVIEFGDPDCIDCSMARLRLETDVTFSKLVETGKINVLFIIPDAEEGWEPKVAGFPTQWHSGTAESIDDIYDLRVTPSIYVIDTKGQVAAKNIPVDMAIQMAVALTK